MGCQGSKAARSQQVSSPADKTLLVSLPAEDETIKPESSKECVAEETSASLCIHNEFYSSPRDCVAQEYCVSPSDVSAEWLGKALNAEVLNFTTKVCGEGQLGVTVIVENIEYGSDTTGRPASVAIKMHTPTKGTEPIIQLLNAYSRELYFYTIFKQQAPVKAPKCLAVWTDTQGADLTSGIPVLGYNLMMENQCTEWIPMDPKVAPTVTEFGLFLDAVLPMHVKFWNSPIITQKPFSDAGAKCDWYEKWKPLYAMVPQLWPLVKENMPKLAGWESWPEEFGELINFIDRFAANSEQHLRMVDVIDGIVQTRPMTLVHGDLNSGNVWRSKANAMDLSLTDWQLLKMAPVGFEFGTMLVVLPEGPGHDDTSALIKTYHDQLPASCKAEYTYQQLHDDYRCQVLMYLLSMSLIQAGQLDPSSMDAGKYEFTWKTYWPSVYRRLNQLYNEENLEEFARQLLAGEYDNYSMVCI